MNKKCPGCGYTLQSTNSVGLGYVPQDTKNKTIYCERCYKLIHYNDALIITNPKITSKIINIVNRKGEFVFFLIDFLNLNKETINTFKQISAPKCLVISKSDIIPKSIKFPKIIKWLKEEYEILDEVKFISSLKKFNINKIPNMLKEKNINTAYILGYTNAGKSSLINKIYEVNQNKSSLITTSIIPNTTIDFINMKINENLTLIDSPGFAMEQNIYANDDIEFIKKINAKSFIKPKTYQVKLQESILLENKFRFLNMSDIKNSMTFYLSNDLFLDKLFITNGKLMELADKKFKIKDDYDIVIKGVGFINIKKACEIKIFSEFLDLIEIRKSVFDNKN